MDIVQDIADSYSQDFTKTLLDGNTSFLDGLQTNEPWPCVSKIRDA
jgi:hypothetical protein